MTLVELQRALRQLRCSGMATGLEGRLLQAQAEKLAPIDFLSTLVQDELLKRRPIVLALSGATWVVESETDLPNGDTLFLQGTAFCLQGSGLITCAHVLGQRNLV